jgi:hypothetical protein
MAVRLHFWARKKLGVLSIVPLVAVFIPILMMGVLSEDRFVSCDAQRGIGVSLMVS